MDLILTTAREKIRTESERRAEIGAILIHLLDHGTDNRPKIARTIATLVPEQRPRAAARVRGYLEDRSSDPVPAGYPDWYTPDADYEEFALAITLGLLDADHAPAARTRFATATMRMVLNFADGYAALGPDYAHEALTRLTECAAQGPQGAVEAAATSGPPAFR